MFLLPMLRRLDSAKGLNQLLHVGMHDLMSFLGAERGNIQVLGHLGDLVIVAQHGLSSAFLEAFRRVSGDSSSVCARAARDRALVFVPDVSADPGLVQHVELMRQEGITSILSFPLRTSTGDWIGMASAHFAHPANISPLEKASIVEYGTALSDAIDKHLPERGRGELAESMAEELITLHSKLAA